MQRNFGTVFQNAFLVPDLERAIDHWTGVMKVGPFFLLEHIQFEELWYRSRPAKDIDFTAAMAYWGDIQIELVYQHNDAPSIYTEFSRAGRYGLHHIGVVTHSLQADLERLKSIGIEPAQHGRSAIGVSFAYVTTDQATGYITELIETNATLDAAFQAMREAALTWDGKERVRSF